MELGIEKVGDKRREVGRKAQRANLICIIRRVGKELERAPVGRRETDGREGGLADSHR